MALPKTSRTTLVLLPITLLGLALSMGCRSKSTHDARPAAKKDSVGKDVSISSDKSPAPNKESNASDQTTPSFKRATKALDVKVDSLKHFRVHQSRKLAAAFAIEATPFVPEWGKKPNSSTTDSRDDDLRTSWTCEKNKDSENQNPCVFAFHFSEPTKVQGVRLFAASGKSWKSYRNDSRIKTVRVHTDQGYSELQLDDGAAHRALLFDKPVETSHLALEVLDVYPGKQSSLVHLAEIEIYGNSGPKREELKFDPRNLLVSFENEQWHKKDSSYQLLPHFIELPSDDQNNKRLMRGSAVYGQADARFLLIEHLRSHDCEQSEGTFFLLDKETRLVTWLGDMGGMNLPVRPTTENNGFVVGDESGTDSTKTQVVFDDTRARRQKAKELPDQAALARSLAKSIHDASKDSSCLRPDDDRWDSLNFPSSLKDSEHTLVCRANGPQYFVGITSSARDSCEGSWHVQVFDAEGTEIDKKASKKPDSHLLRYQRNAAGQLFLEVASKGGQKSQLLTVGAEGKIESAKNYGFAPRPPSACQPCLSEEASNTPDSDNNPDQQIIEANRPGAPDSSPQVPAPLPSLAPKEPVSNVQ